MLGNAGYLLIGTNVYDRSLEFLNKLYGKNNEGSSADGKKYATFDEGKQYIALNESDKNYSGLLYYNNDIKTVIKILEEEDIEIKRMSDQNRTMIQFETIEGLLIRIVEMDHQNSPNPVNSSSKVEFSKFGEYAVKSDNLDMSCEFWQKMGFKVLHKDDDWHYAIVSDDIIVVGLHEHDMDRSAITYFHPDMPVQVELLKKLGIKMRSEKKYKIKETDAVDATATSPDGQVFYFFTGDL